MTTRCERHDWWRRGGRGREMDGAGERLEGEGGDDGGKNKNDIV